MSIPFLVMLAVATAATTTKGTVEIVFSPYLAGYGYSLSLIGLLTSLVSTLQLVSRLPVGLAYHPERAKGQFAVALVVFAVTTAGFAFSGGEPAAIALLAAVQGFAFGSIGTLGLALAIDVTHGRRAGSSMAAYTAAIAFGYALGSLAGGNSADRIGIPATLALISLLPVAAALAVVMLPGIEGAPLLTERGAGLRGLLRAGAHLDVRVWLAFVTVLYLNVLQDGVDAFFPVFARDVGLSLAVVGVLRACKSTAAIAIRLTGPFLLRALDHRRVGVVAVLAAAAATIAIPSSTLLVVLVPIWIVLGLTRGILRATSAATIAELRGEGKDVGLASGVYNAGLDIGGIVGPLVGGAVASAVGIGPMFQLVAAGALLLWIAVAALTARRPAAADAPNGPNVIPFGDERK